jgi:hypothetical protein
LAVQPPSLVAAGQPIRQPARICQTIDQHLLCLRQAKTEVVDIPSGRQVIKPIRRTRMQSYAHERPATRVSIMRVKASLTVNKTRFCLYQNSDMQ